MRIHLEPRTYFYLLTLADPQMYFYLKNKINFPSLSIFF